VLKHFKEIGEYVEDQPIMRVAQLDPLSVEVVVPLEMRHQIRLGMRALVYPQSPGAEPVEARVTVIDAVADAATGTFGVQLTLPNPDNNILSGVKCALNFGAIAPGSGLVQR
jgi:multidrug efflux pump subunit AcrA (membrane-fusion protein)